MFVNNKKHQIRKTLSYFVAISLVAALTGFSSAQASADELPTEETITVPMYIGGYNEEVAEANGFEIVIGEDGMPYSIPVTPEAQELEETYNSVNQEPGGISAFNIVYGPCGASSLNIARTFNGIYVATSYSVKFPSYWHNWNVSGSSNNGGWSSGFSGANASTTWNATHFVGIGSYSSGFGQVTSGSYALLINGLVCYSGSPSAYF